MNLVELLGAGRIGVWGLGVENLSLVELLLERGAVPRLFDEQPDRARTALRERVGADLDVERPTSEALAGIEVLCRAPGVSRYRPELAEFVAHGGVVETAFGIWLSDFRDRRVLAVIGTKGKSTTATYSSMLLERLGVHAALAGNIGKSVIDLYREPACDAYVVEASSFQSADVTVPPSVVVLTSLSPDHLDWHGDLDHYYSDKLRMLRLSPPPLVAVNAASAEALAQTSDLVHRVLFGGNGDVQVHQGALEIDGRPVVPLGAVAAVGAHNALNLCGAVTGVGLLLGAMPRPDVVASVARSFTGLPHRCERLGVVGDVACFDDSLASNPYATATSVAAFADEPLAVVLGGADRGVAFTDLCERLWSRASPTTVILLPEVPPALADAVAALDDARVRVVDAGDVEEAVAVGLKALRRGVLLFSPGAPTPPGQGNYLGRSERFRSAVAAATGFVAAPQSAGPNR